MKTAVIQMNAGDNKKNNIGKAKLFVEQAIEKEAKFILLPEVFNYRGYLSSAILSSIAEDVPGESTKVFSDLARKSRTFILIGSVYEKIRNSKKVYNTSVLINDKGKISAVYRKINLFEAVLGSKAIEESKFFQSGKVPVCSKVDRFNIGLSVCYDLRFPQLYQTYSRNGADILCIPSAFTYQTGQAHWKTLVRARAIENLCYVLAPNQIGEDVRGIRTFGHSLIISPWGEVLAEASEDREEIIYAQISSGQIEQSRSRLPGVIKNNKRNG